MYAILCVHLEKKFNPVTAHRTSNPLIAELHECSTGGNFRSGVDKQKNVSTGQVIGTMYKPQAPKQGARWQTRKALS